MDPDDIRALQQLGSWAWITSVYTLQGCDSAPCVKAQYVVFGRQRDAPSVCFLEPAACSDTFLPVVVKSQ